MTKEEILKESHHLENNILSQMALETKYKLFRADDAMVVHRDALLNYVQSVIKILEENNNEMDKETE